MDTQDQEHEQADDWTETVIRELTEQYAGLTLVLHRAHLANFVVLDRIVVGVDRQQGIGSAVLRAITAAADKHGDTLALTPEAMEHTTSRARLVRFYKGFGFIENTGRNRDFATQEAMYRRPQENAL